MKFTLIRRRWLCRLICLGLHSILCSLAFGDDQKIGQETASQAEEILDNKAVIGLKEIGLGETVIVEKIKSSTCSFDTSLQGLKNLKAAGVADSVIAAMVSAKAVKGSPAKSAASGAEQPEGTGDANDPRAPHDAGIWLWEELEGKPRMIQLEPSVYSSTKGGVAFFAQFGQSVKSTAVIRSAHADLATTNRRPIFYFYFEKTKGGLSDAIPVATSANEYTLAQFEVSEKDNNRKVVIGQFNAYAGSQAGTDDKSVRSCSQVKLSPGVYKVSPREDLANGEYCFYYGAARAAGAGRVFDFRVKGEGDSDFQPVSLSETKDSSGKTNWFRRTFSKKPAASQKGE